MALWATSPKSRSLNAPTRIVSSTSSARLPGPSLGTGQGRGNRVDRRRQSHSGTEAAPLQRQSAEGTPWKLRRKPFCFADVHLWRRAEPEAPEGPPPAGDRPPRLQAINRNQLLLRPVDVEQLIAPDHPGAGHLGVAGTTGLDRLLRPDRSRPRGGGTAGARPALADQHVDLRLPGRNSPRARSLASVITTRPTSG